MAAERPVLKIAGTNQVVQITDDNSRTLMHPETGVAFHSASGALAETRHVYLHNSGVQKRLENGGEAKVLEIGLGTGMGMLLTVNAAVSGQGRLEYHALESDWLCGEIVRELDLERHLSHPDVCEHYLAWRDQFGTDPKPGSYVWRFSPEISATVHHHDARIFSFPEPIQFDAIYFDPFAPAVNPELWSVEFLGSMKKLLIGGGHLVTYCVNRRVKDALLACGYEIRCLPGPVGGKREVMRATRPC